MCIESKDDSSQKQVERSALNQPSPTNDGCRNTASGEKLQYEQKATEVLKGESSNLKESDMIQNNNFTPKHYQTYQMSQQAIASQSFSDHNLKNSNEDISPFLGEAKPKPRKKEPTSKSKISNEDPSHYVNETRLNMIPQYSTNRQH